MGSRLLKKGRNPSIADNWLDSLGLYRKNVAFDETCLFRAASEQIYDCQVHHERVRKECIEYARNYWTQFVQHFEHVEAFFAHLELLENHMVVCGNVEIEIISYTYGYDVLVYNATHHTVSDITQRNLSKKLRFCLIDDHYDVIYKKEQIEAAGFCQSIVYKLLYEEVFKIRDVDNIVNGMLYAKSKVITQAQMMAERKALGETFNTLDAVEDLQNYEQPGSSESVSVAPFPFKVAKALDPTIYRNIEYDSWGEVRREMRLGEWYHGDDNLTLGTKCNYHRNDETFECYIQELFKETNECVVYLTKSAERLRVNYTDLSPEDDAKPWPLPYRFSKNLAINNSPQSANDKFLKTSKKQSFKDKRRTKSCSEGLAITRPVLHDTSDKMDNIHLFIGDPLQIRCPSVENTPNNEFTSTPNQEPFLNLNDPGTENIFGCDQSQWHLMSQTPNPFVWPTTPSSSQSMFNFPPMVASAPVTPDVIPYHHQNFPYYYNCHVEPNTPNYYPWSNQLTNDCFLSPPPDNSTPEMQSGSTPPKNATQSLNEMQQSVKEIDFSQICSSNQQHNIAHAMPNSYEKTNIVGISTGDTAGQQHVITDRPALRPAGLSRQNSIEMYPPQYGAYSPIIPIAPPPQTIMYSPQVPEMVVPQQPYTVYTPTVDIQYVSPNPTYVYPPTPPAAWYPAGINSQGFIFPPPTTAQNTTPTN